MDIGLAVSGVSGVNDQLQYINPLPELESLFPDCEAGYAESPGTCPSEPEISGQSAGVAAEVAAGTLVTLFALRRRGRRDSVRAAR